MRSGAKKCNSLLHNWLSGIFKRYEKSIPRSHNSRGDIGRPGGNKISIRGSAQRSQILVGLHHREKVKRCKTVPQDRNSLRSHRIAWGLPIHYSTTKPIWNDPHLLNKHAAITRLLAWLNAAAQTYLVRCDRFAEVHGRLGLSVKD